MVVGWRGNEEEQAEAERRNRFEAGNMEASGPTQQLPAPVTAVPRFSTQELQNFADAKLFFWRHVATTAVKTVITHSNTRQLLPPSGGNTQSFGFYFLVHHQIAKVGSCSPFKKKCLGRQNS